MPNSSKKKNLINWKLYFILLAVCFICILLVMPYTLALAPSLLESVPLGLFVAAQTLQSTILFAVVLFLGLLLAKQVGFGAPVLEGWLKGEKLSVILKPIWRLSIVAGVLGGIAVIILSLPFANLTAELLDAEVNVAAWKGFLASFYGGIAEEVLSRLFLVTLFTWIGFKIAKTKEGRPTPLGIWLAIILSAILFGLGHLGITGELTAITAEVIVRAILLNGVVAVAYGWLFWKKGLESAMIAHFSTDIVLHVITPFVVSLFIS
jgi:membrane protease YdiL (CAAX protease family)